MRVKATSARPSGEITAAEHDPVNVTLGQQCAASTAI
jgi:hypothetical protein